MYLTSQFSYSPRESRWTANLADLGLEVSDLPPTITLKDWRTGQETSFRFVGGVADKGDLQFVMYRSDTGETIKLLL